ncbi:MAG: hypothetical protein DLD55_05660 [candidate division SR1 bacterium]|nr:MAG: hypothetical protein DLD55_05660 [candidate division SR1 bacterium]
MLSGEITPDFYIIQKEGPSSGYVLTYKIGDTEEEYQKKLTSAIAYCQKGGNYRVKVDFNFDRVVLRPSLYAYGDQRGFEILSGATSLATGVIAFDFCSPSTSTECTDFGEILFDARTAQMRKRFCKLYYAKDASYPEREKTCRERSTGN